MQFYAILKAYTIIWNCTMKISEEKGHIACLSYSATDALDTVYELHMKRSN